MCLFGADHCIEKNILYCVHLVPNPYDFFSHTGLEQDEGDFLKVAFSSFLNVIKAYELLIFHIMSWQGLNVLCICTRGFWQALSRSNAYGEQPPTVLYVYERCELPLCLRTHSSHESRCERFYKIVISQKHDSSVSCSSDLNFHILSVHPLSIPFSNKHHLPSRSPPPPETQTTPPSALFSVLSAVFPDP